MRVFKVKFACGYSITEYGTDKEDVLAFCGRSYSRYGVPTSVEELLP